MINTKTAPRRQVEYATLDQVVADAERLVDASATTTGNWSLGQILEHIATVMDKSIDGFDSLLPFPMRMIGRWVLKKWFLKRGMPAGIQLKGPMAKELVPDDIDPQQALEHLRNSAQRLLNESHRALHPVFGPLNQTESNRVNCRHAELHMSFVAEP